MYEEKSKDRDLMKILNLKSFFFSLIFLFPLFTQAKLSDHSYYKKFLEKIQTAQRKDLPSILRQAIGKNKTLSYKEARKYLFGDLFIKKLSSGYSVRDVYCHKDFGSESGVAPHRIPNSRDLNCEHTWPQSRFNPRENKAKQKGDLHHLFPSDKRANSTRGNLPFGDVAGGHPLRGCPESSRGYDLNNNTSSFEPPQSHKGNVARALFYFSIRYKISIPKGEEEYLRKWNRLDPVDRDELSRNNRIEEIQGNRNPFIDEPELVEEIRNF